MRNITKLMVISILTLGLGTGYDALSSSQQQTENTVTTRQQVSLIHGKLAFTLPRGLTDQSGRLKNRFHDMYIYSDHTGQRALTILVGDRDPDDHATLPDRFEAQQRFRDANLQVVANETITVNGVSLHRFDTIWDNQGRHNYSCILTGLLDGQSLVIRVRLPAGEDQQAQGQAQSEVNDLISTLWLGR